MNLDTRNVVKQMIRRELTQKQEEAIDRANMFHSRVNGRGVSIEHLAVIVAMTCDDVFVDKANPRPESALDIPEFDDRPISITDVDKLSLLMNEWSNTPFDSTVEVDCGDFGKHEGTFRGVDVAQNRVKVKFKDGMKRHITADRVRVTKRYDGNVIWNRNGELVPDTSVKGKKAPEKVTA